MQLLWSSMEIEEGENALRFGVEAAAVRRRCRCLLLLFASGDERDTVDATSSWFSGVVSSCTYCTIRTPPLHMPESLKNLARHSFKRRLIFTPRRARIVASAADAEVDTEAEGLGCFR